MVQPDICARENELVDTQLNTESLLADRSSGLEMMHIGTIHDLMVFRVRNANLKPIERIKVLNNGAL